MSSLSTYDKKVNVVFLYPSTICMIKLNQHCIVYILLTCRYWTRTIPECPTQRLESSMPDSTWMAAGTAAVWMLVNRTREWPWPILIMGIGRQFPATKSGTWSLSGAHYPAKLVQSFVLNSEKFSKYDKYKGTVPPTTSWWNRYNIFTLPDFFYEGHCVCSWGCGT